MPTARDETVGQKRDPHVEDGIHDLIVEHMCCRGRSRVLRCDPSARKPSGFSIRCVMLLPRTLIAPSASATMRLSQLRGVVTFRDRSEIDAQRAVQLLNKTNQFNLNGERVGDHEFSRLLEHEHSVVLEAS